MSQVQKARRRFSLVREYETGDLSLPQFCKAHRISKSTFCYWRRKFKEDSVPAGKTGQASPSTPRFVRLDTMVPMPSVPDRSHYELSFPDGRVLRMPSSLPVDSVLSLLKGSVG